MSTDRRVTADLIETLEDGKQGYAEAAEKLADSDRPELAGTMREFSEQRARFSAELEELAATYGDDIDEDGSAAASVHRAWMSLKDTISGSDPDGVLDAAVQGEDHAVKEYEQALGEDISANLRTVVERQFDQVKQSRGDVMRLRNTAA